MSDRNWDLLDKMIGITMLILIIFAIAVLISLLIQITLGSIFGVI